MNKVITVQTIAEVFKLPKEATPDILKWLNGGLLVKAKPNLAIKKNE